MDQILRLNEFFVEGGKQNISHVLLHINEPSNPSEAKKGYFFALSETNNASTTFIAKFQDIIERAQTEYYEILEEETREPFEIVLEKMNGEAFVLEHEAGELHSIVGAIRQKEIIFSYHGNPQLLLYYRNKLGNYEKMDLVKNNEGDEVDNQLFSQVIQGKLTPNDYLFAGTPHIIDFFSHDRLEKIITTRTPEESAGHIEKVLSELKNGFSFGGLIIHLFKPETSSPVAKKLRPAAGTSSKSLQSLFNREQTTANTLSPSLLPKLDRLRGILNNNKSEEDKQKKPPEELSGTEIHSSHINVNRTAHRTPKTNFGDRLITILKTTWVGLKIVGRFILQVLFLIYSLFYNFFRFFALLFVVLINYKNRRNTILENWRLLWRARRENFERLPIITKLILFGSITLAAGFMVSILYIQHRQKVTAEELVFNNTVRDLQIKKESVESSLIYKNDEQANADFKAASDTLSSLNCKTTAQKSVCLSIKNDLATLGIKLRKITNVQITKLATFDAISQSNDGHLLRLKNKLIAYSSTTSTLFIYDLLSGEVKTISTYPSITGFTAGAVPKENDYALFLYNKKQLVRLDPTDLSVRLADISFASDKSEINSFAIYNRRLYALDTKNGTILRNDSIKNGFGQSQEWLKDKNVSLLDGSDLTIDGDVFITKNDGQILKYTTGNVQPFMILGLIPPLSSPSKIWTYTDVPYLYILEPVEKRLVVFEKNGHFVGQYTNDSFVDPTGFSIDYTAKIAYILDSGKLLKFPLQ